MKLLFILTMLGLSLTIQAKTKVQLRDIGVVGLMSHDIFAWDHKSEVNTENGRLDLSTIFDYEDGKRWKKGGNPKNEENAPVYTITMDLVDFYKTELKRLDNKIQARKNTVALFHKMIKDSFERLSGMTFPTEGVNDMVTNTEQAALRGMHDILPGKVKMLRPLKKELVLTNAFQAKTRLNENELNQELKDFDGDYDQEYKNIKIPFAGITINLKEIDRKFIEKFSPFKQSDMLTELAKVGRDEIKIQEVFFLTYVFELVSKAICPLDNTWMPQEVPCR